MERNIYKNISPFDHRYSLREEEFEQFTKYFSEEATVYYQAQVELALVKTLAKRGVCPQSVVNEVKEAIKDLKVEEVYQEEAKTRHNIRAFVNCIRAKVSAKAKPFVHLSATSYDIIDTASSLRMKQATKELIIPKLELLLKEWLKIAHKEKTTIQIGRTHGQQAEPITFGLVMAFYASRLAERILTLEKTANSLVGKMSGAVGAYNASHIFFTDPDQFEKEVLTELGLQVAPVSTQIIAPEYFTDFIHVLISIFGVLADFSDDMRHLQRSEIGEVGEYFALNQVGSSTMPHKRNPINYENVKSMWKAIMPKMITVYQDQLSEHQRDLTNSASGRFMPEVAVGLLLAVNRLKRVSAKMQVDRENMLKNFNRCKDIIIAEPLYIILAANGHDDAHEYVRKLTLKAEKEKRGLSAIIQEEEELKPYLDKLEERQKEILANPHLYTGIAGEKTEKIVNKIRQERGF